MVHVKKTKNKKPQKAGLGSRTWPKDLGAAEIGVYYKVHTLLLRGCVQSRAVQPHVWPLCS